MQNNDFKNEVYKNKNNVFMSKELENIVPKNFSMSSSDCIIELNNRIIEGNILTLEESFKKIKLTIQINCKELTCFKLENFLRIIINDETAINLKNTISSFKVYLNNNKNILKLKLKKECEEKNEV